MFDNQISLCLFCKKLHYAKYLAELRKVTFDYLQEILQCHPFLISRQFDKFKQNLRH